VKSLKGGSYRHRQYFEKVEKSALMPGYFGASTCAAFALKAAARLKDTINAVVSRGGRPDLAKSALAEVKATTLLIVGSLDEEVIELNEQAYSLDQNNFFFIYSVSSLLLVSLGACRLRDWVDSLITLFPTPSNVNGI
jgi:hypothetical protein